MADNNATLTVGDQNYELPLLEGSVGPDVVDIRKLYAQAKMFTYDPGYTSTASCESALTYIDGEEGVLLHRGYPIGQLAEHSSFMEVSYLMLNGELPSGDGDAGHSPRISGPFAKQQGHAVAFASCTSGGCSDRRKPRRGTRVC